MAKRTIDVNKLPGNSRAGELSAVPAPTAVASGQTSKKGVSLSSMVRGVVNDIFFNVVVPQAWNMVADFAIRTIQEMIPGQEKRGYVGASGRPVTAQIGYHTVYSPGTGASATPMNPTMRASQGIVDTGYHDIFYPTYEDARMVLAGMVERIARYNQVTLGDMRHLSSLEAHAVHQQYYWTDLTGSEIVATGDGRFMIKLPDYRFRR